MSLSPQFDGFSEPSENYYRLPNTWFEIAQRLREAFGERFASLVKMLEYILRHTWGFRRFDGVVRLSAKDIYSGRHLHGRRLDQGTGLSENTVARSGRVLQELGLIEIEYDESDQARRVRIFRPRIRENPAVEKDETFVGFDSPTENYFKVPAKWTDLTRQTGSGACILATEYFFRHGWGYNNPDGIWMDADEVANGRRYIKVNKRYDRGIGFDLSTTYRALNESVERGFLVWAERWKDNTTHRVYNLRLKGMPLDVINGKYLGRLPWDDNLLSKVDGAPICIVEEGIDAVEGDTSHIGDESTCTGEAVSCKVEDARCTDEVVNRTDEARTEASHTLIQIHLNQTRSSDTPAHKEKLTVVSDDGKPENKLPDVILTNLDSIGWEGDTGEVARAYTANPDRVAAWLTHILGKRKVLGNPAGLFRTRLRDNTYPPGYHKPTDPNTEMETKRALARQRIDAARQKSGAEKAPGLTMSN